MSQDDQQRYQFAQQGQQYPRQYYYQQQQYAQYYDPQQYQMYYQQQPQQYAQQQQMYQSAYHGQQYHHQYPRKQEKRQYDKSELGNPPTIEELRATYPALQHVNIPQFKPEIMENARYFILRSSSFDNVHKAIKHGLWTSTVRTNQTLDNVFYQCQQERKELILLFTVVGTHAFQGAARLIGPFNPQNTFRYWDEPLKWLGSFPLQWIYINELTQQTIDEQYHKQNPQFNQTKWTDHVDCSEISSEMGLFILQCFKAILDKENKLLLQFPLMNKREEDIRFERDYNQDFINQMYYIQADFEQEPFKQRQKKPQRHNNFQNNEQSMYYQGYANFNQLQQYQQQQEEPQPKNIEEKFYVKPQKQKKVLQKKQLKLKKDNNLDYQQDPNTIIPQNVQESSEDESKPEQIPEQ